MSDTTTRTAIYERPAALLDTPMHFCAGCSHSTLHRLLAEILGEMGMRERCIGVAPVGCAVLAYDYLDIDWTEAAHGRPPAVATGLKRTQPDKLVFTYQGDGDLASIGMAETIHAANRGENITIIFVNNGIYGMTQGQMAPTTLVGQKTNTSPRGRDPAVAGWPIPVCELLDQLTAPTLIARTTITSPRSIRQTKKLIRKAFQCQLDGKGFSFIEVLSACPTYWRMTPSDAHTHIDTDVVKTYPLGTIRDRCDDN